MDIKILYENNDYVVCLKPSGVAAEDGSKIGMPSLLGGEGTPLLTVHRLDKEVSGVTVYAKNKYAASKLSHQMQNGKFGKEYYAVVEGEVEGEGRYEDYLFKDSSKNKSLFTKISVSFNFSSSTILPSFFTL